MSSSVSVFRQLLVKKKNKKKKRWKKHPQAHLWSLMFCRDSADGNTAVILNVAAKWGSLSRWGGKRYFSGCWRRRLFHELCFLGESLQYHTIVQVYCWMETTLSIGGRRLPRSPSPLLYKQKMIFVKDMEADLGSKPQPSPVLNTSHTPILCKHHRTQKRVKSCQPRPDRFLMQTGHSDSLGLTVMLHTLHLSLGQKLIFHACLLFIPWMSENQVDFIQVLPLVHCISEVYYA